MMDATIGFIGAGNMAEAIVKGLLEKKVVEPSRLTLSDPSDERREHFKAQGLNTTTDNAVLAQQADVVVLAVKPQVMASVLEPLQGHFRAGQLVISIAAGIRTEKLDAWCGGAPAVVRVMPNTPALVGRGVSALCAGPRAGEREMALTAALFDAVGTTLVVDEEMMDAVTAISGSGPAYVFHWLEAMLAAARAQGFDEATARKLVYGTLSGAAALAEGSAEGPDVLRARVTSKGGTTEAALRVMQDRGFPGIMTDAVEAAARRSRELSST
jgi:pyrroline-5-carboxylate reductase